MKYLLLDGKNVNVEGCKSCPLCQDELQKISDTWDITCGYPGYENLTEIVPYDWPDDHYIPGCPLSPYQSLHHLYVSIKCIYQTVKTLYDNFRKWWHGRKRLA